MYLHGLFDTVRSGLIARAGRTAPLQSQQASPAVRPAPPFPTGLQSAWSTWFASRQREPQTTLRLGNTWFSRMRLRR